MDIPVQTFAVDMPPQPLVRLRRVLMFPEVAQLTGYSRPSIYRLERAGRFPRRVKLGQGYGGKVGFYADEIATWLASRTAEAVVSGAIVGAARGGAAQ